jgi:hypothetical protein
MISMGIRALVHVSALSVKVEMSAFYCFVVLGNRVLILNYQLIRVPLTHVVLILVEVNISLHFTSSHSSSLIVVFSSVVYIHLASSSSVVLFEPSSYSSYILILRILIV